jgi:hypothetical protein
MAEEPYEKKIDHCGVANILSFVNMEYALLPVATTPDGKLKYLLVTKFTVFDAAL